MSDSQQPWGRIAIVGRAGRFPAARNVDQLWSLLAAGRTASTRLSDESLLAAGVRRARLADPHYVKSAQILPDMECFDAGFWGFSPREAAILDPQHRHFLECAWEALEDAGHLPETFRGRIGVFAGVGMQAYFAFNLLSNPELVEDVGLFLLRHTGNDKDFLPTRLSYLLNLTGPSLAVQTACSTGLVSVHMAVGSLLSMECDLAIAGGVTIEVPHRVGYRHVPGEILSPDGVCRAFDDDSQGTVFGSGIGLVVLRRLQDALDDGDDIKAVILGSAINNDGSSKVGYLAPSVDGQASAAAEALALAGVPPETVTYLEAHGTGTPIGDPIELAALSQAYGGGGRQFCGIGSVKTNIGHLDTAAGTASLIKVVEALRHGQIPPSLNYRKPNRRFDLAASPFYVVDRLRDWPRGATPRRAAVNSIGVGGTNAHVIVEEAPLRPSAAAPDAWRLLPFSARTRSSLADLRTKWQEFAVGDLPPLADVAYTLRTGRRTYPERMVIAARTADDLRAALAGTAPHLVQNGTAGSKAPEVVFLFPGGGAQHPGAGADLLRDEPAFAAAVEACFAGLAGLAPDDLRRVMFGPAEEVATARERLGRSSYAIPALFVLEYAYAKLWQSWGIQPAAIVAHSVGEYAAAVIAGALGLADALRLVALRGRVMDAAPPGAMTTVPAAAAEVSALVGDSLDLAACNAPELTVVSGSVEAIEALEARLRGTEREAKRIHIDVAGHSRLLDGQLERFRAGFAGVQFGRLAVPVVSSLRGDWAQGDDLVSADYWVRHLRQTVRFTEAVSRGMEQARRIWLEVGPGQSLGPLVRLARTAQPPVAILASARRPNEASHDTGVALAALGALWAHGVPVDLAPRGSAAGRRVSLPTYAFAKDRHWIEPGRGATVAAAAEPARPVLERLADQASWCEGTEWYEVPLPPPGEALEGPWLVFAQGDAGSRSVLAALAAQGVPLVVVRPGVAFAPSHDGFELRPDAVPDYEALCAALPAVPQRILHLWALDGGAGQQLRFDAAFGLLRALQTLALPAATRLVFATAGAVPANGDAVRDLEAATIGGAAAVAARELPDLEVGVVDVDPTADPVVSARQLLAEATAAGAPLLQVAWRAEHRWAPRRCRLAPLPATSVPHGLPRRLREAGVYVLTGGTGGIGRELALWLAATAHARVALVSRAAVDDPAFAARIRAAGGDVRFLAVDVTDRTALAAALATVRAQWGNIHGVFHAAGTIDDAPLAQKTLAAAHRVLAPKVDGGRHLAALLPPGSLDLFAVFSSSSVVLAPAGQVDYVAANAWLEALAAARPDGLAIAWGVWRDLGMAERAYGAGAAEPHGSHPLLGRRSDDTDGEISWTRRIDPQSAWVVAEHQVGGLPVLPGTAYVELAAAAAQAVWPGQPFTLQQLSLLQPLVFPEGLSRLLTVRLRPRSGGHELLVESRIGQAAGAIEHARARLVLTPTGDPALPASLRRFADTALAPTPHRDRAGPQDGIRFGPRWQNVLSLRTGPGLAEGRFALPEPFLGDLDAYLAHPALLDMAATVGLELLAARGERGVFAPVSVDRLRWFAPLPREVHSQAALVVDAPGRLWSFDVVLRDGNGRLLAVLEGLALRAVPPTGMAGAASATSEARLTDLLLAHGIQAAEAPALFARVLDRPERQVVVSPVSLDQVRAAMVQARQPALRPSGAAPRVTNAPRNAVEQRLAGLWSELLGVAGVGRDEDFFALGGHSLHAVRLLARVRKEFGVDLALAVLFAGPTVEALAARVVEQRPELDRSAAPPAAALPPGGRESAPAPAVHTIATTEGQREIFAAILIDPDCSLAYNLSFSLHVAGALDGEAVAAACRGLVARHESLRGTFAPDGLSLHIHRELPWQLAVVDLADLDEAERARRLAELHAAAVETPFDLRQGPVFRATWIRHAVDQHELLFVVHHIACDGWSIGVLMRDFHALYECARRQQPPGLPPAQGIAQFQAAEQAWANGREAAPHRAYWLARFAERTAPMELPIDLPRPPVRSSRAARRDEVLAPALEAALRQTAKELGATLPNFVFAAFQVYLGRITGNPDIVVGLPASGQLAHDLDGVVGHCVNFLPIRNQVAPASSFAEFLREVRASLVAALDHPNYGYGALVRDLNLPRDPARIALVPAIFNIDNLTGIDALPFPGLRTRFTMNPRTHEHFEWFLNLLDEPGRVLLSWSYHTDLFTAAAMAGHVARFRDLLQGLAAAPQTRLGEVGRLLVGAVRPASGEHDDPGAAGPQSIPRVFRRVAAQFGPREAVRFGVSSLDYATLDARSDALAAWLVARGVRPGGLVGITSQRSLALVVAVLGVLKAGAGYVPFDTALPAERLVFMAQDTAIGLLLGECAAVTAAGVPTLPFAEFPQGPAAPPDVPIPGTAVAYVMYTSGTTGRPKGVVLPHQSVIRMLVDNDWLQLGPDTVTLHSSAFAFDTSIIDLFGALLHGGCVVVPPDGTLSLQDLAQAIASGGVNTLWLTSGLFHAIADLRPQVFAAVDQVVVGGDVVSPVHVRKVMDACPRVAVINGYGPTESNVTNAHRIRRADLDSGQALPIGRAIRGTQIYILDPQGRPVEPGVQGELCISGRGLALGYHARPELTAEKFVTASWDPALRLYRSGDLAMDPGDGVLRFFGRMDGQVKIRGFRIELVEVEAALESHPQVRQAVVVAVVPEGQADKVLAAYLVPEGTPPDRRALQEWLEQRLPEYARPLLYQTLASIPLNSNGKVDRRQLPPITAAELTVGHGPLVGDVELRLAALWCQLLGLRTVGAEANFFDLGGHSLLAVRLFDAVRKEFGVDLPISTLFQQPTVRALAAKVAAVVAAPASVLDRADDWDTSVVIHAGPAASHRPLFLVGGVGGNVNNLYELGRVVGRHRPLVGFQTRGILGHRPHESIEAMATEHIRYLKRHQPTGPYLLAGYSGGALTAFEMARQLVAGGERVDQLFILDTFAPGFAHDFRPVHKAGFWRRLRVEAALLRDEGLGNFWFRLTSKLQNQLRRGPFLRLWAWVRPAHHRLMQVEATWRAAARNYVGGHYPGRVTLLQTAPRGMMTRLAWQQDPTFGWRVLLDEGHFAQVLVPGDHTTMILGAHAEALVAELERRVQAVEPPEAAPDQPHAAESARQRAQERSDVG